MTTRYAWEGLDEKAWVGIAPMREADVLRMVDTWPHLRELKKSVQKQIAARVDGHPRTVEFLDTLVAEQKKKLGRGAEVRDAWAELVEPVLPATKAKVTENLLLETLWGKLSDGAQAQARAMSVLRRPAPWHVAVALGEVATTEELVRTGVVTQFKEMALGDKGVEWIDRWGMHSVVRAFAEMRAGDAEKREAHRKAGVVFGAWVKGRTVLTTDVVEGIAHLHAVGEGDLAWPMALKLALWLRDTARYREAKALLESCEAAGTSGDRLALVLALLGQARVQLGERSDDVRDMLERALGFAASDEVHSTVVHELGRLLDAQGKHGEAEILLRQSLALVEKSLGKDHPSYAASLHSLAGVLNNQGKYGEAPTSPCRPREGAGQRPPGVWHLAEHPRWRAGQPGEVRGSGGPAPTIPRHQ